ncbi:hypothetical protein HZA85_00505 [Candidatus Uhrbacteria bacterium]|nr:hypothetical protein [Candidatus Uhrbacteria bacterium]
MAIKRVRTSQPRALTAEQKVAFAILLFLGLGGFVLGFRSFGSAIRRPFDLQIAKYLSGEKFMTSEQRQQKDLEASKTRDTDGDGLNDYDELYVYKTSPYLTDSDSDGFDDKTEIFSNNDPNCPQEKDCSKGPTQEGVAKEEILPGLNNAFADTAGILASGKVDFKNPEDVKNFFRQATIEEIRKALIQAGVPKDQLDQISDEDLTTFFNSTLDDASNAGAFDALVKPPDESTSP